MFDSDLNEIEREIQEIDWEVSEAEKSGYDHFMYKEILEQSEVIERTISGRLDTNSDDIPIMSDYASKFRKNLDSCMRNCLSCRFIWQRSVCRKFLVYQ